MNPSHTVTSPGPMAGRLLTTLAQRDRYLFTSQDARRMLHRSALATNKLLHRLARDGYVQRLEKGKFLLNAPAPNGIPTTGHEFLIAMGLVQPSYIAYWTALHYHGLTEQMANVVFVATTKQKRAIKVHGVTYQFVTLAQRKFFGIETQHIEGRPFRISDPERTLVDCFAHPEYCGGMVEAAKGLRQALEEQRLDLDELTRYALRLGNRAVLKRMGYLIELYELPADGHLARWRKQLSSGFSPLDPLGRRHGHYNSRWSLLINRDPIELSDWRVH